MQWIFLLIILNGCTEASEETDITLDTEVSIEAEVDPEDVIRLEGGRRVDGAVTYSGNGDGTINLYNVPYNWDVNDDVEDDIYIKESEKVLENIETDYIEPMEDEAINQMIGKLEANR